VFRELCTLRVVDDGVVFSPESVRGVRIREDQEYGGVRVKLEARIENARVPLQVDVGFGDAVKPEAATYPTLLDFPAPRLRAYPREAVVAEKLQAMVVLGLANSRMKDFYDLWNLAGSFSFEGERLGNAVRATFERRKLEFPRDLPLALTADFAQDASKKQQWKAFLKKTRLAVGAELDLGTVLAELRRFLGPLLDALAKGESFVGRWPADGPWQ